MKQTRRRVLALLGYAVGLAMVGGAALEGQSSSQGFPEPGQDASQRNPSAHGDQPDSALAAKSTKAMLEENQKDIKKNVEKLFNLASELKDQVEKTDSATVLSLALIKKTEEIEKLARQIRERAKG